MKERKGMIYEILFPFKSERKEKTKFKTKLCLIYVVIVVVTANCRPQLNNGKRIFIKLLISF
jgi:hypothetical protein